MATEVIAVVAVARLARAVDGEPGGRFLRILTRTIGLVVVGQVLEVITDVGLDAAPVTPFHEFVIVLEAINLVLIFFAIAWAWWDLTRHDLR